MSEHPTASEDAIVFFDGVCGLCNGTVNFLLDRDHQGKLRFAPLQGNTANELLSDADRDLNTIVLAKRQRVWKRSSAIVRIFWMLGGLWLLLGTMLWIIPKPIRDLGYNIVAKLRYRLFGKHETCRMPTEAERGRMLD